MAKDPEAAYPALARAAKAKYGPSGRVQDLATGWLNDRAAVVRPTGKTLKAWNDGFFTGGVVNAAKDLEVEYWTGKEIGARQPVSYLSQGRKMVNLNDEYLYYVLGEPNDFAYPTGRRIYEQWTPLVVRGTAPVPAKYDPRSSAPGSPSGATWRTPRPRPRSRPASGCPWRPSPRSSGTRRNRPRAGTGSGRLPKRCAAELGF